MNASSVETSAHRLCTFDLGARRLCIDVAHLQELLRPRAIVPVPLAPPAIAGLTNLRGQIVTAIDLGRLLDPCAGAVDASVAMILVVRTDDGAFGLLVDGIGDVLELDAARGEPPPANLPDAVRALAARAWKLDGASTLEIDVPLVTRPATLAAAAPPEPATTGPHP